MLLKKTLSLTCFAFGIFLLFGIVNVPATPEASIARNENTSFDSDKQALLVTKEHSPNYAFCVTLDAPNGVATFDTIYGKTVIPDRLLCTLLTCAAMERIKYVRQYGTLSYTDAKMVDYSRFAHSVGVMLVLRKFAAPYTAQLAGLLHDVSHTVFSHVGDHLGKLKDPKKAYQDEIHQWYLEASGVAAILAAHSLSSDNLADTNKMVDCDLPDLCADRIEYNIMGGILTGFLTAQEIPALLENLHYQGGRWYFDGTLFAKKLALASLFNTEHVWGGPTNELVYQWTADTLNYAVEQGIMTPDEIHFSIDPEVWLRLHKSRDPKIISALEHIKNPASYYTLSCLEDATCHIRSKFRGVDPWIRLDDGSFKRLTECDAGYRREFDRVQELVTTGWYVKSW